MTYGNDFPPAGYQPWSRSEAQLKHLNLGQTTATLPAGVVPVAELLPRTTNLAVVASCAAAHMGNTLPDTTIKRPRGPGLRDRRWDRCPTALRPLAKRPPWLDPGLTA